MSAVATGSGQQLGPVGPDAAAAEAVERIIRARRRRRAQVWAWRVLILALALGLWQLCSGRVFPAFVVSSPSKVAVQLWDWLRNGYILSNLGVTMGETAIGFVGGAVVGSVVGLVLGISTYASDVVSPYVNALYALPKIMLGPLLVVWFGIELEMKAILSGLFVVFIVFYNIWSGVREVDRDLVEMFAVMGAKRWAVTKGLYLPSAMTWLFTSLRIAFPVALIGSVVGEFIASNSGVGYVVTKAASVYNAAGVYVGIIAVTIAAVIVDALLVLAQRQVTGKQGKQSERLVI